MPRRERSLLDTLRGELGVADASELIAAGEVLVDGIPVTSPRSQVRSGSVVTLRGPASLRGSAKLRAALDGFGVDVAGQVAIDVGAAAGGFTTVLLERGARRVYAVDAGHGQLRGALRQDPRVVNLESVNVAALDPTVIPQPAGVVTVDVSYLSLRHAVAQLDRVLLVPGASLVGLVKPMFELRLGTAPTDRDSLDAALAAAVAGVTSAGWTVRGTMPSPVAGAHGAREMLLWAAREGDPAGA